MNARDKNDYRIEALSSTFSDHADKFDEDTKRHAEKFPDHYLTNNGFNLSRALAVMCCEIERLKHLL